MPSFTSCSSASRSCGSPGLDQQRGRRQAVGGGQALRRRVRVDADADDHVAAAGRGRLQLHQDAGHLGAADDDVVGQRSGPRPAAPRRCRCRSPGPGARAPRSARRGAAAARTSATRPAVGPRAAAAPAAVGLVVGDRHEALGGALGRGAAHEVLRRAAFAVQRSVPAEARTAEGASRPRHVTYNSRPNAPHPSRERRPDRACPRARSNRPQRPLRRGPRRPAPGAATGRRATCSSSATPAGRAHRARPAERSGGGAATPPRRRSAAIVERLASFRGEASFTTWLHRVAANACTDHARRLARVRRSEIVDGAAAAAGPGRRLRAATSSRSASNAALRALARPAVAAPSAARSC